MGRIFAAGRDGSIAKRRSGLRYGPVWSRDLRLRLGDAPFHQDEAGKTEERTGEGDGDPFRPEDPFFLRFDLMRTVWVCAGASSGGSAVKERCAMLEGKPIRLNFNRRTPRGVPYGCIKWLRFARFVPKGAGYSDRRHPRRGGNKPRSSLPPARQGCG